MTEMDQNERPLDSWDASAYCESKGFPLAQATLVKLRHVGGGPDYLRYGRRVLYRPRALEEWLAQRTMEIGAHEDGASR